MAEYDKMRGEGCRLDRHVFSALIAALGASVGGADVDRRMQLVLLERAFHLLDDMKVGLGFRGLFPCTAVNVTALVRCNHAQSTGPSVCVTQATERVSSMPHRGLVTEAHGILFPQDVRVQPDAVVYNALVAAAGRAGQLQRALEIVSEMEVRASEHHTYQLSHTCQNLSVVVAGSYGSRWQW